MPSWKSFAIALIVGTWLAAAAEAQGVVPGGWAPQFTYQSVVGPGVAGFGVSAGYPAYGYGTTFPGLTPYYGTGSLSPFRPVPGTSGTLSAPTPQTVNAMDPLIGAIRQSTRRKGSR
jgi:hypothetical protein